MSTTAPPRTGSAAPRVRTRGSTPRGHRRKSPKITTLVLVAGCFYFLTPLWWLFVSATKSQGDLNVNSGFWFASFQLWHNLTTLFGRSDGIYWRWLLNSLIYAGLGAALATLFATLAGYALAKYPFPGRELFFSTVLVGVLVPATALALPLFLLLSKVSLTNSYAAVLLPSMVSPFGVYLTRIHATAAVPDELVEAARIDGAGEFRIFFRVAFRLMTPATITLFIFQFIGIWNNFFLPLIMLNDQSLYPITLGLYTWSGLYIQDPTLITSVIVGSFVSLVPLIVGFVLVQRYWRGGLTVGSVKG